MTYTKQTEGTEITQQDRDLIEIGMETEAVYDGCLLHVKRDTVRLPNGKMATREWVKHPGASAVLPLTADGRVLLVRQYRYPVQRITLEIPAGKLDVAGEDPLSCAQRELQEETGYTASNYEKIMTMATTVGFSNEWIHLYLATDLSAGEQHPDEDEFIHVLSLPLDEAVQKIATGEIVDAKTVIALLYAKTHIDTRLGGK